MLTDGNTEFVSSYVLLPFHERSGGGGFCGPGTDRGQPSEAVSRTQRGWIPSPGTLTHRRFPHVTKSLGKWMRTGGVTPAPHVGEGGLEKNSLDFLPDQRDGNSELELG